MSADPREHAAQGKVSSGDPSFAALSWVGGSDTPVGGGHGLPRRRPATFHGQVTAEGFHGSPYQAPFLALRNGPYLEFPDVVSIETLSLCNATYNSCPYPALNRKGEAMPDELIEKILADIEGIENRPPFQVNLSRVDAVLVV